MDLSVAARQSLAFLIGKKLGPASKNGLEPQRLCWRIEMQNGKEKPLARQRILKKKEASKYFFFKSLRIKKQVDLNQFD